MSEIYTDQELIRMGRAFVKVKNDHPHNGKKCGCSECVIILSVLDEFIEATREEHRESM